MEAIDINCDVGEGMGIEGKLFPFLSSCNIACGGHAGDQWTMTETVQLAQQYGVRIGAHPSYPDRKNFGRVSMDLSEKVLIEAIQKQMESLLAVVKQEGLDLHHVKLHGALYNDVARDRHLARTVLRSLEKYNFSFSIYVPYRSAIASEAIKRGIPIMYEAFGDRRYQEDLSLVSRNSPSAVIQNPKEVLKQVISIVRDEKVETSMGNMTTILADTLCIHGDNPFAFQIVSYLSQELPNHNIRIKK